jgi:hypothetical protein
MSNQNSDVLKSIKEGFSSSKPKRKRNIRIPSGINLSIDDNSIKMKLSSVAVCANMQKNEGAFDGWAFVIKRWSKYEKVVISWDKPDLIDDGHYQRFLFRLLHFSQDFDSWFLIDKECQVLLNDLKIKDGKTYLLNIPNTRGDKVAPYPEAMLEDLFVNGNLREPLMNISNAISLYRQLPVGVFESKVSKSTSIFTGGKSAIDIWGVNKSNELLVFELKADNNEMVGIISELYFYVCVLQKVRKQIFKHKKCQKDNEHLLKIAETKKIKAYFLAPTLHPLIDRKILRLLNEETPDEIEYQYIQFSKEYKLALNTFN